MDELRDLRGGSEVSGDHCGEGVRTLTCCGDVGLKTEAPTHHHLNKLLNMTRIESLVFQNSWCDRTRVGAAEGDDDGMS